MVLNITDGLRSQYEGGPDSNAKFVYLDNRFISPRIVRPGHDLPQPDHGKRKEMGVAVNENPRFTEYLRYAEKLGLGIADLQKIQHVRV